MPQSLKARNLQDRVLIAAGPTGLTNIKVINTVAAAVFVQFFNANSVAAVQLGTTTPDYEIQMAASSTVEELHDEVLQFTTGLVIAATTAEAGGTTAAAGVHVFLAI